MTREFWGHVLWGVVFTGTLMLLHQVQCSPAPGPVNPDPVPPPPPVDAGADVEPGPDSGNDMLATECLAAQETICVLDCRTPTGIPICAAQADGVSFAARCISDRRNGVPIDAVCIATITDCAQLPDASTGSLCADGGAP